MGDGWTSICTQGEKPHMSIGPTEISESFMCVHGMAKQPDKPGPGVASGTEGPCERLSAVEGPHFRLDNEQVEHGRQWSDKVTRALRRRRRKWAYPAWRRFRGAQDWYLPVLKGHHLEEG